MPTETPLFDIKQLPTMTPGEFFDRYTIVLRKAIHIKDSKYQAELIHMEEIMPEVLPGNVWLHVIRLMMINSDIWSLESDMRKGKEGKLGYEEVGRRALLIRDINATRVKTVNAINELFGIHEKEEKFDHASEQHTKPNE